MCGACARVAPDWAGPMVSGPIRRASIARFLAGMCHGVKVGTFPGGWTVSNRTGATRTASTFDELLDMVAPRCSALDWDVLDAALVQCGGSTRDEEFSDYLPKEAEDHEDPESVLTNSDIAPTHLRLAAFGLGLRALKPRNVAVAFPHRLVPFRLVAVDGVVQGAAPLHGLP